MIDKIRRWFVGDPPSPPEPSPALRQAVLRQLAEAPSGLGVPYRRLASLTPRLPTLRATLDDMYARGEIEDPGRAPADDTPIRPAVDAAGLDEADRLTAHAADISRQIAYFAPVAANTFGARPAMLRLLNAYQVAEERAAAARQLRDARVAASALPTPAPTPTPIPVMPAAMRRGRIVE